MSDENTKAHRLRDRLTTDARRAMQQRLRRGFTMHGDAEWAKLSPDLRWAAKRSLTLGAEAYEYLADR